jgi:hypothetical protein
MHRLIMTSGMVSPVQRRFPDQLGPVVNGTQRLHMSAAILMVRRPK